MMFAPGINIVVVEPVAYTKRIKRTWKERLLSWTPWRAYRTEQRWHDILEDGQVVRIGDRLHMSARTKQALLRAKLFDTE
jgi:hypothetical protein